MKNSPLLEIQKILNQWKSRKITDAASNRLMHLLLGMPEFMCEQNYYPLEFFDKIRQSLKFSDLQSFAEVLRKSNTFGIIADTETKTIVGFYSPFLFDGNPEEIVKEVRENGTKIKNNSQHLFGNLITQSGRSKYLYNILYNNFSPSNTVAAALKSSNSNSKKKKREQPEKHELYSSREADVKKFFHDVKLDSNRKAELYDQLRRDYAVHNQASDEEAREYLILLVQKYLIPHYTGDERFAATKYRGKFLWVKNLLKSAYGVRLKNKAKEDAKILMQQRVAEQAQQQLRDSRTNHPLSPFEWTDFETQKRFYDDEIEGMVLIPDFAEPRPSADAQWNVLSQKWM